MQKKYFLTFFPGLFVGIVPFIVVAAAPGSQFINFANNILKTANLLVTLSFVVALLVFAYGIIRFLFAAGDANGVSQAKGYILWGVVGMAVLASIYGIIVFIQNFFGISGGGGNIQAPNIRGSTITLTQ